MRIKEKSYAEDEAYTPEIQEQVKTILQDTVQILEARRLLNEIKKDSAELRNLFWTEEELQERKEAVNFFDVRMQAMVYYTLNNLKKYQQSGWRELMDEGEDQDGTAGSI